MPVPALPPPLKIVIGGALALAFVLGMVLIVQSHRPGGGGTAALIEPPRSAAVVLAPSTPVRRVSPLPSAVVSSAPPRGTSAPVESRTRPPVAPVRTAAGRTTATTPRPAADVIAATYAVGSSWDTGFIGSVEVRNISDAAQSWSITVRHAEAAGVRVTTAWNATLTRQGDTNIFTGGPLPAGATVRVGFEATKQTNTGVRPTACSARRGSCRVS
jgi:hypothetical protein